MTEGYEISYHPIVEDSDDIHSEACQDRLYLQATKRTQWPGTIDKQYLSETDNRAHFIVVEGETEVVKILVAPSERDYPTDVWNNTMTKVLREMQKRYPFPKYATVFGGSCLQDAMRAFPKAINYRQVPVEQIILTPKPQ